MILFAQQQPEISEYDKNYLVWYISDLNRVKEARILQGWFSSTTDRWKLKILYINSPKIKWRSAGQGVRPLSYTILLDGGARGEKVHALIWKFSEGL